MSKVGEDIIRGMKQALAYAKGENDNVRITRVLVPERINVARVRKKLNFTQQEFADFSGISVSTLRDWEQNRRLPRGPARALLTVIDRDPGAVKRALAQPPAKRRKEKAAPPTKSSRKKLASG